MADSESTLYVVMTDRIFFDEAPAEVSPLPAKPRTSLLAYGTVVEEEWDDAWLALVTEAEKKQGHSICGARRNHADVDGMIRTGKLTDADYDIEKSWVCTNKAGLETQHQGQGRCYRHGGNTSPGSKFSFINQPEFSSRVHNYFEAEGLLDLRGAIATLWVAANSITDKSENGEAISVNDAKELGSLMSRIGAITKQHHEIMEKRKISIEVPEFIAWAEHFYELAIKYILGGEKDIQGFLAEAKSYYDATVTIKVGLDAAGDGNRASHPFSGDSAQPVLGSGSAEH